MRFEYADGRMPVAMTSGGVTYYLAYDQVGSLKAVADASGNVVRKIGYDSFGNIIEDTNPSFSVPFGFASGLHDRDMGLVRFGFRDYDPDVGRWTAKDPIGFAGGDTDLYGYCVGDPINMIDPKGTIAQCKKECQTGYGECMKKCVSFLNFWWIVPVDGFVGLSAAATTGSAAAGLATATLAITVWEASTTYGCMIVCLNDTCSYDF